MSNHTTTLRNIIFHYSQDNNPLHQQEEKRYAFIRLEDEMGVMEKRCTQKIIKKVATMCRKLN